MSKYFFCLLPLFALSCTPFQVGSKSPYANKHQYPTASYYHKYAEPKIIKPMSLASNVKVTQIKYLPLPEKRGYWTGLVEGEGDYNLRLNFYKKSRLLQSKNIGSRSLLEEEGPMWFKFNSSLPKTKNYTWKIVAYQQ